MFESGTNQVEQVCIASEYLKLDIIEEFPLQCSVDKVITRFIQDRLRISNDQGELKRFYVKIVDLNDQDILNLCKK